jgi:hypothetical protein
MFHHRGHTGPWTGHPFFRGPFFGHARPHGHDADEPAWGWPPFGGRGRPWGRGGRAERLFDRGDLKYVILDLLWERPRHGYDIIRALEERFHGLYSPSPGTVYPTLQLLEDQDYVTSSQRRRPRLPGGADGDAGCDSGTDGGGTWLRRARGAARADGRVARPGADGVHAGEPPGAGGSGEGAAATRRRRPRSRGDRRDPHRRAGPLADRAVARSYERRDVVSVREGTRPCHGTEVRRAPGPMDRGSRVERTGPRSALRPKPVPWPGAIVGVRTATGHHAHKRSGVAKNRPFCSPLTCSRRCDPPPYQYICSSWLAPVMFVTVTSGSEKQSTRR